MMMTERQLKAVRAEKSDTSAIKKLQSDVKVLENKLQNKKDENSNLSREISDLKRYNLTIFNLLNRQGEIRVRVRVRLTRERRRLLRMRRGHGAELGARNELVLRRLRLLGQ